MAKSGTGLGILGRLRLTLGSLVGDATAKEAQEAVRRLDEFKHWLEFTFGPQAAFRADLVALEQYGGEERGARAAAVRRQLEAAEREARERLARGYAAIEDGRPAEASLEAAAVEPIRARVAEALQEFRALAEAHRRAQREAWDAIGTSGAAARAGLLAQEVAALPDIPQLPKPDVRAFTEPYQRLLSLVPLEYQRGESDAICFDPDDVQRLAGAALAAAPNAEEALTRYLYEAARGYEAALGRERAQRLLALLRDPAAVRDLRAQRPELYPVGPQYAPADAFSSILPLLLVTSLFAHHAPGWQPAPAAPGVDTGPAGLGGPAGAAGATGPLGAAPAGSDEIDAWLAALHVPTGEELGAVLGASAIDVGVGEGVFADVAEGAEVDGVDGDVADFDTGAE